MDIRKRNVIVNEFNLTIKSLIGKLEKRCRTELELANLERLKQRLSTFRKTMGDEAVIKEAGPFLLKYSEKIIARDKGEAFFMEFDPKKEVTGLKKSDEFVYSLIDTVRTYYQNMKQQERDQVYNEVKLLHDDYLEYLLAST